MKAINEMINESLKMDRGFGDYMKNPMNEDELFAVSAFFEEMGVEKAIKQFVSNHKDDPANEDFRTALEKIMKVTDHN